MLAPCSANAFLYKEYQYLAVFILGMSVILMIIIGFVHSWASAGFTTIAVRSLARVTDVVRADSALVAPRSS